QESRRIIDNVSEIAINVDNYSSSETYISDDKQSINSQPSRPSDDEWLITNKIAK
ncbi:16622_t:CDS:1, partial [Gigaspora rosea]